MKLSPGSAFQLEGVASAKAPRLRNMLGVFEASKEASVAGVEQGTGKAGVTSTSNATSASLALSVAGVFTHPSHLHPLLL